MLLSVHLSTNHTSVTPDVSSSSSPFETALMSFGCGPASSKHFFTDQYDALM